MAARLELRTRARTRADQTNSTFSTDASYNFWIDEACKEVWGDLLQAGWPLDYVTATITATGAATYAVGAGVNIFGIVGVFYTQGLDTYELKRVNQGNIASLRSQQAQSNRAGFYELRVSATSGLVIELYPRPTSGTYTVNYSPDHPGLPSDVSIWYGPNRSDELVCLKVAAKALHQEGMDQDSIVLETEYTQLLAKVQNQATWLDMRNPAMIRDVRSQPSLSAFDFPVAGPERW